MTRRPAGLAAVAAALTLGALAGCSGGDDDGTPTAPASTTPASTAPPGAGPGVPRPTATLSPGSLAPRVPAPSAGRPVPIPSDQQTTR